MTEENLRLLEDVYKQYINPIKPLLAEIEALYEKFPLQLYNEIRALNDHVARAFVAGSEIKCKEQISKSESHVNRIILDCYKCLDLYYKRESERFDRSIASVEPRDDAEMALLLDYGKLSDDAVRLVEYAKINEKQDDKDATYQNFEKAYLAYRALHDFIIKNRRQVFRLHRKRIFRFVRAALWAVITFVLGCVITNNNQAIWNWLKSLFR